MDEGKPQKLFVDGLSFFKPREGAPEFVKGNISIEPNRLVAFLKANKEHINTAGYFSIDLKKSREGKLYCELNTWKSKPKADPIDEFLGVEDDIKASEIPFN